MSHLHLYLKSNGFNPDLKYNHEEYINQIHELLGKKEGNKFLKSIEKLKERGIFSEEAVVNLIGNNIKLLKLVYSSQIEISKQVLDRYIGLIQKLRIHPKSVMDIGGGNGWAVKYLSDIFLWDSKNYVLDRNSNWDKLKNIEYFNQDYSEFKCSQKYDFFISVLGASHEKDINSLLEFIHSTSADNFTAILCLRIATESAFLNLITTLNNLGIEILPEYSKPIRVDDEKFPIVVLKKSVKQELSKGTKLQMLRYCFSDFPSLKRVCGFEAEIFLKLIEDGELIEEYDFEELYETNLKVKFLRKNDIVYRLSFLSDNSLVIDYPIISEVSDEFSMMQEIGAIPFMNTH